MNKTPKRATVQHERSDTTLSGWLWVNGDGTYTLTEVKDQFGRYFCSRFTLDVFPSRFTSYRIVSVSM